MVVGTGLTAGLDDLRGLFQPQQFQDAATIALTPSAAETEFPNDYVKNFYVNVLLKIPCFLYQRSWIALEAWECPMFALDVLPGSRRWWCEP